MKKKLRFAGGVGLHAPLLLLILALAASASADGKIRLGYIDSPGSAGAAERLEALEEAVFRFEYFNENTQVLVKSVNAASPGLTAQLKHLDAVVAGRQSDFDSLASQGSIIVTGSTGSAPGSASAEGLVDALTAFIPGSAGLVADPGSGGALRGRVWTPPQIVSFEPASAAPDETVYLRFQNAGYFREGAFRVRFSHLGGQMIQGGTVEPDLEEEGFRQLEGYLVSVPADAQTGPLEFEMPSQGTPSITRSFQSAEALIIEQPFPLPDPEPAPAPAPSSCDNVGWHRLGNPNFFSELADSKDLVISDVDRNGRPDVFIPQTFSDPDTLYKHLGNDAAGLPRFATVISGIVTNDIPSKRQYGVAAGDIDGDLWPDIIPTGAAPTGSADRMRILINNQNLTFTDQAPSLITNWTSISSLNYRWDEAKIDDVNGDGIADIALANRNSQFSSALLIGNGGGSFTAFTSGLGDPSNENHHDLNLCDFDNDGRPDVVFSHDFGISRPVRLHLNRGGTPPAWLDVSSRFIPMVSHESEHVGCADFDNDGRMDVHMGVWSRTDQTDRQDLIYLNRTVDSNGNGVIELGEFRMDLVSDPDSGGPINQGFRSRVYSAGYGDFNGDSIIDIVSGTYLPGFAVNQRGPFLMCGNGDGTFTNASTPLGGYWPDLSNTSFEHFSPTGTRVADLNADGLLDIVFAMGDGLNNASEEINRIFIQERITGGGGGGGGGGGCLQLQEALKEEPCRIELEPIEALSVGSASVGEVILSPLAGFCKDLLECPPCGGRYLPCRKDFELALDFQAAGVDPKAVSVEVIDFGGELIARDRNLAGRKVLNFTPEGRFRKDGVDQELYLKFQLKKAVGSKAQVPISLAVKDK